MNIPKAGGHVKPSRAAKHTPAGYTTAGHIDAMIAEAAKYTAMEPDADDKRTMQGIVGQLRALKAKDRRDPASLRSMIVKKA